MKIKRVETIEETVEFALWLMENASLNHVNLESLSAAAAKRQIVVYVAYDENGPVMYFPVQTIAMLGPLAPRPDVSSSKRALAIRVAQEQIEKDAQEQNIGMLMFAVSEPSIDKFAQDRMGWSPVAFPMLGIDLNKEVKS